MVSEERAEASGDDSTGGTEERSRNGAGSEKRGQLNMQDQDEKLKHLLANKNAEQILA